VGLAILQSDVISIEDFLSFQRQVFTVSLPLEMPLQ
jgi:hypothetical protein